MRCFEKAPAKINLSLDVLGKRSDGYHEVEMIMTSIDLIDRIELVMLQDDRIVIHANHQYVPDDERNLAYKAAKTFKENYRIKAGVRINIEKNIPVSAGLGGGSSDAAAILRGLNRMWSIDAPLADLANLGNQIGSDVPFCIYGTTARVTGRGEQVQQLPAPPACYTILAKPNIGVSTRDVFQKVCMENMQHPPTPHIMSALYNNDFNQLCAHVGNALEAVTLKQYPIVKRIKTKMVASGADGVLMSGSGPTIVGFVRHASKGERIYNGLRGFCDDVSVVRLLDHSPKSKWDCN